VSLPNAPSSRQARHERYNEDNEEDEEQDLRDPRRCDCHAAEAEDRGDDGYRQEDQSPIEHRSTPSLPACGNRGRLPVVPAPELIASPSRPPIMRHGVDIFVVLVLFVAIGAIVSIALWLERRRPPDRS
jgi:hypothetical protein